jgi:hypothetical protein
MCIIIPSWCRKHSTSLGLVYINTGPCRIIWFYRCSYTGVSNQHNVSPSLFDISRQFDVPYNPLLVTHTPHVARLVYIYTGPCHAICSYCCSYTGIRIQLNVSPSLIAYLDKSMCVIIPSWCRIHSISLGLVYITTRPSHIIRFYHCTYTGISIQFTVSPSLFHISRQFDVHYNPLLVP